MDYLLKPSKNTARTRPGAAVAIIVFYCLLLLLVAITYFRLLYTVLVHPGYTPRGPQYYATKREGASREKRSRSPLNRPGKTVLDEKSDSSGSQESREDGEQEGNAYSNGLMATGRGASFGATAPGLEDFYTKDVFVCEGDGRPIWCSTCLNWKADRTHHCREVQRCVRKMDHFCPW